MKYLPYGKSEVAHVVSSEAKYSAPRAAGTLHARSALHVFKILHVPHQRNTSLEKQKTLLMKCFCISPETAGVAGPRRLRLRHASFSTPAGIKRKNADRRLSFYGDGGSRTRVRKPIHATFSGCRRSTVFPAHSAVRQAERVGSFLMHDGCKSKLTVHVRR